MRTRPILPTSRRRHRLSILATAALIVPFLAFVAAVPAQAAGTQVSVNVTMADGFTPMTNAEVDVFYQPPNPPDTYNSPLMATGTTNSSGSLTLPLDTSMVSDLGDIGDGNQNAFNAEIIVFGTSGEYADLDTILTLSSTTSTTTSVSLSQDPSVSAPLFNIPACSPVPCVQDVKEATAFNYAPVLAENSGAGMKVHLEYTHTTSLFRQTSANVVVSPTGTAPWSAGGTLTEQADRSTSKPWNANGSYHYYAWVNYRWYKWKHISCGIHRCSTVNHKWKLNWWTGDITDNNPNPACNGCRNSVGQVPYKVPAYTTNRNYTVPLDAVHSPSLTRESVISHSYGFQADFAGFVSINDTATYGHITSVTWSYVAPQSLCGQDRLLWGNGNIVSQIPIVQANCFTRPS